MGDMRNVERDLLAKPDKKKSLGRQKHKCDDNIDTNIKETGGRGGVDLFI
jgi:hypothetical protein